MTVFMDTYGLIGWLNMRDFAHQRVKSYLDSYSGNIVTTEWILLEFADAFSLSNTKLFAIEAIKRIHRLSMFEVGRVRAAIAPRPVVLRCSGSPVGAEKYPLGKRCGRFGG